MGYIGAGITRFNTADELTVTGDAQIDTTTLVVDSTNNRVGIGTASPGSYDVSANNLVIYEAGNAGITIAGGTSNNGSIYFADGTAGTTPYRGIIQYNHSSDYMRFSTAATEAVRIDSSQNLLVGKTSQGSATVGGEILASGTIIGTRSGSTAGRFNRTTSDGAIVDFRKDNTVVGSIRTASGAVSIESEGAKTGLLFGGDNIYPRRSGSFSDGTNSLGGATYRFKDLYLSGGVYLGGTGSANHLDDYEEGEFTPAIWE